MEDSPIKTLDFTDRSDEWLKQLAIDIHEGKVFTDRHIREEDYSHGIKTIFIPLALGSLSDYPKEELGKIGLIFEYMHKASPTSINGYPSFMSVQMISVEQAKKVDEYWQAYKKLREDFAKSATEKL